MVVLKAKKQRHICEQSKNADSHDFINIVLVSIAPWRRMNLSARLRIEETKARLKLKGNKNKNKNKLYSEEQNYKVQI